MPIVTNKALLVLTCALLFATSRESASGQTSGDFGQALQAKESRVAAAPSGADSEFQLESSAFRRGEAIPREYTCDGRDISPSLAWTDPPAATKSFVLIVEDPDAPGRPWIHWIVYDLSPSLRELPAGLPTEAELSGGVRQGTNDFGRTGYGGPCPPGGSHRYVFELFAVDSEMPVAPGATARTLKNAMKGHVLGEARLMGTYRKQNRDG